MNLRLSYLFDPVPVYSLVFLRICWGLFGFYGKMENAAVFNLLDEMVTKPEGIEWSGLNAFLPYQNFSWIFDIFTYLYGTYPQFMVNYFQIILDYGLRYSALAYGFGFLSPISGPLYCLFYNITFFGKGEVRFVNHYYMKGLIIFLLIFTNAGKSYGIDSILKGLWKKLKGEKNINYFGPQTCPRWNIIILRLQVCIVFLFATTTKLQEDWLRGEPWRSYFELTYRSKPIVRFIVDIVFNTHPSAIKYLGLFISYAGIFYDAIIIPSLFSFTIRPISWTNNKQSIYILLFSLGTSTLFHTGNAYITQHIGQFPRMTLVLYTLFLQYNWPILFMQWIYYMFQEYGFIPITGSPIEIEKRLNITLHNKPIQARKKQKNKKIKTNNTITNTKLSFYQRIIVICIIIWFISQLMIPTRHIWNGTKHRSLWTSQATFFNWRMMMVTWKIYKAELYINHHESNRTMLTVPLKDFHMADTLTTMTENRWERADYVVAVAHHIANIVEKEKGHKPQIYANVIAGLNRRIPQSRFKPGVNLVKEPLKVSHRWFIEDEIPLSEEQWNDIPYPILYLIRTLNLPLWG